MLFAFRSTGVLHFGAIAIFPELKMSPHRVLMMAGDGVGEELLRAAQLVLKATKVPLLIEHMDPQQLDGSLFLFSWCFSFNAFFFFKYIYIYIF